MYTRIDLTGLADDALARATSLRNAVDQANTAHAAEASAPGSAAHIAIDRELQRQIVHIESLTRAHTYRDSLALRTQLTIARDQVRNRLIASGQSPQPPGEPQTSLSQQLAELPDLVAQRLAQALVTNKNNQMQLAAELRHIYPLGSDAAAMLRWNNFLNTHSITFLGGSNIINFKVEALPPLVEPTEVLKLENRFGYPSHMDTVLRNAVPGLCTSTAASRMVRVRDGAGTYTGRSLMVTTLCTNGGAGGYAKRGRQDYIVSDVAATAGTLRAAGRAQIDIDAAVAVRIGQLTRGMNQAEKLSITAAANAAANAAVVAVATDPLNAGLQDIAAANAVTTFKKNIQKMASQMCTRFQDLEAQGIYFPDAKLDNWVVEGDGTLRVADTKSFKRSPRDAINEAHIDNDGIGRGRLRTPGFNLADIDANCAPKTIHKALLGRNIYFALTGRWPHDINSPNCTEPVFQGDVGIKYRNLIQGLTRRTAPAPGIPQPTISLPQAAQVLREIEIMHSPTYALASMTQKALMIALAATPAYTAANDGQRVLMSALASSDGYEAASPARRILMAALATHPGYEAASPNQKALTAALAASDVYEAASQPQRILMAALASSPGYEAATPERRTLMAALATNPSYEAATPAQRILAATLAASPGYEAATPLQRTLMTAMVVSPGYETAIPDRRALMFALTTNPSYETATSAQRTMIAELASQPLYEAALPATRQRMIEAMLTPAYAEIVAKIRDLEVLTGQDHKSSLLASLNAACASAEYDRDTALATLRETANRAFDTMTEANTIRATITTPPQPKLGGQLLLPDNLLVDDRVASIGVPADLNALVAGLETHRAHLVTARGALAQVSELQTHSDACNAKRFGPGDIAMTQYLANARQDVFNGVTLVNRITNAQRVHGELAVSRAGLHDAANKSIHDNITRLRGKYFARGADAKATAIENAAALIPIPSRANLRAHEGDAVVQALFSEMGRTRTLLGGLGATAAKPQTVESYKLAMKALRPPQPGPRGDDPDRDMPGPH